VNETKYLRSKKGDNNMKTKENINKQANVPVENSFIKNYVEYVDHMENNNWTKERVTIHEHLSSIVTVSNLKADNEGMIIDIICPPGRVISIMGIKDALNGHNTESIHPFELKLSNSNGEEIDPDTHIKIIKRKILGKNVEIYDILYKEASMTNYSQSLNMFKSYAELYRLEQGIQLKGEDHLMVYVVNSNIDIDIIKFSLDVDLWTQTE
jgi:hypothetical protein